ncbi:MAG: hypothetical protein HYU28_08815 [Actinobacteria bacterium]|nr:hypothetical protein [Actinomycetota bacterium]
MDRRRLATFAAPLAVLLVLLALGACGGDETDKVSTDKTADSDRSDAEEGDADGDDTAGSNGADAGDGGGQGSGNASGGATTTTGANVSGGGSGPAPPAPTAGGAAQPAADGTYTYDTDGETTQSGPLGGTEELPKVTTLKVDPADGGRQRSVRDTRDENGEGGLTTTVLLFGDDGVYLESLKTETRVSGINITYEFAPAQPQLLAPTGAGVGYHTEFELTSTDGDHHTATTIDVLSAETLTIGGESVRTFKVRTHTVVSGDVNGEITSNDNVDPERYLIVREDSVSDLSTALGNFHTEQVSLLRSVTPS